MCSSNVDSACFISFFVSISAKLVRTKDVGGKGSWSDGRTDDRVRTRLVYSLVGVTFGRYLFLNNKKSVNKILWISSSALTGRLTGWLTTFVIVDLCEFCLVQLQLQFRLQV